MSQETAGKEVAVEITISAVRSRGRRGGVIVSGRTSAESLYVARCSWALIPDSSFPDVGQIWAVRGTLGVNQQREWQIEAAHAELVPPSSDNIVAWITQSSACRGIGVVKAQRLFDHYGNRLIDLIAQRDLGALTSVLSAEAAGLICYAFEQYRLGESLVWLRQIGTPPPIARKVVDIYRHEARAKVEANPYSLLAFEAQWKWVDRLSRERFNISEDDPRRLEAGVEEALYRGLKHGHTCLPRNDIKARLKTLLRNPVLVDEAMKIGKSTQYYETGDLYQSVGMELMEREIAERLLDILGGETPEGGTSSLHARPDQEAVESAITRHERAEGFRLSPEQRQAVLCSAQAHLSLLRGGTGTGKATVLKTLYDVLETIQERPVIHQIALTGNAAQRMSEATGRPASTITAFLASLESAPPQPRHGGRRQRDVHGRHHSLLSSHTIYDPRNAPRPGRRPQPLATHRAGTRAPFARRQPCHSAIRTDCAPAMV
nr:ATP-dependent RecD-like DNA helicase [Thioalkalivibrio versutus]